MKPILRGYGGKPCSAHLSDKCSLITTYYLSESQAVITRQEFSLKGEMREIGAGLPCLSLHGSCCGHNGVHPFSSKGYGMILGILGALCPIAEKSQTPTFSANTDLFQMPLQTTKVRY